MDADADNSGETIEAYKNQTYMSSKLASDARQEEWRQMTEEECEAMLVQEPMNN